MASSELQQLIQKLDVIQKDLGGPLDNLRSKKDIDEFNSTKLLLAETINFITKKQNERDETIEKQGRGITVIKIEVTIKDQLHEADGQLAQLQQTLKRQRKSPKKYPADQVDIKEKQYDNYKKMIEQLRLREEGGELIADKTGSPLDFLSSIKPNRKGDHSPMRDLDTAEQDALKNFQENDKKLDNLLEDAMQGLDALHGKAKMMGDQIAHQEILIEGLDKEVEISKKGIETANGKLKKVLYEYKKPGSFCVDIFCFLLLLGLIGVIIKLGTQK